MALTKRNAEVNKSAPAFEEEDNFLAEAQDTVAAPAAKREPETIEQPAAEEAAPAAKDPTKSSGTALVKPGNTSLAKAVKFETVMNELKDAIPKLDFGVIPRLVATQGSFQDADGNSLGDELHVTVVSYNDNFVCSPGDDSEAAKEFLAFSSDGVTIDETGESVVEYIRRLKDDEGYESAAVKHYVELVCILNDSAKEHEAVGGMVMVSLSPQSRKSFEGYRLQRSVQIKLGRVAADAHNSENVKLTAVSKKMGGKTFTQVNFKAAEAPEFA